MPNINASYNYIVTECNKNNVGYSQTYRAKQTINGITYYDCSSLIWYALLEGGFDVVGVNGSTYPFTTSTMGSVLLELGFKRYSSSVDWKNGDIVWKSGHCEMVYSGQRTMGAHTDEYVLADQVSINANATSKSYYTYVYRYEEKPTLNWISKNAYLSLSEMQNNALIIYHYLIDKGWTINAISGMLGNMQTESTINCGIWQSLTPNVNMGWGLVQWTPSTNFTIWAKDNGYANDDGYAQLKWIDEETVKKGQWIATSQYSFSFASFKVSTQSPEYLASAFLKNFERAGVEKEQERREQARYWYNYLLENGGTVTPTPPTPPIEPPIEPTQPKRKKMPLYMMVRRF